MASNTTTVKMKLDLSAKYEELKALKKELKELQNKDVDISVKGLDKAEKQASKLHSELNRLQQNNINVQFTNLDRQQQKLESLKKTLSNFDLKLNVNSNSLKMLDAELKRLKGAVKLNPELDTKQMQSTIRSLESKRIRMNAEIEANQASINRTKQQIENNLAGQKAIEAKIALNDASITKVKAQIADIEKTSGTIKAKLDMDTSPIDRFKSALSSIDYNKFGQGFASAISNIGSSFTTLGNHVESLGGKLTRIGSIMSVAIGAGAVTSLKSMASAWSDAQEATTKFEYVVGKNAQSFRKHLDEMNQQLGYSNGEMLDRTATLYSMAKGAGIASDKAEEMSASLLKAMRDAGSFANKSEEEIRPAIESIFTGQTKPMMNALGISLHVASLESYALSKGITKSWKSMTQAEKATLRYQYVMDRFKDLNITGDWWRTMEKSLPNQLKFLESKWENLKAVMGEPIANAIFPMVKALGSMADELGRLSPEQWKAILTEAGKFALIAPTILGVGIALSTVGKAMSFLGGGFSLIGGATSKSIGLFDSLGGSISNIAGKLLPELGTELVTIGPMIGAVGGAFLGLIGIFTSVAFVMMSITAVMSGLVIAVGLLSQVGDTGIPFIDNLKNQLKDFPKIVNGFIDEAVHMIDKFTEALSKIDVKKTLDTIFNGVGAIHFEALFKSLMGLGAQLQRIFIETFKAIDWLAISNALFEGSAKIVEGSGKLLNSLLKALSEMDWNKVAHELGSQFNKVLQSLQKTMSEFNFGKVGEVLADGFKAGLEFLATVDWGSVFYVIASTLVGAFKAQISFWFNLTFSLDFWKSLIGGIINILGGVLSGAFRVAIDSLKDAGQWIWDKISGAIPWVSGEAKKSVSNSFRIADWFYGAISALSSFGQWLWDKIVNAVYWVADGAWRAVAYNFNIAGWLWDSLGGLWNWGNRLWDLTVGKLQWVLNSMHNMVSNFRLPEIKMPSMPSFSGFGGFHLPFMADGGILNKATPVIAGEAGEEAIVPMERGQSINRLASVILNEMSGKILPQQPQHRQQQVINIDFGGFNVTETSNGQMTANQIMSIINQKIGLVI